MANHNPALTGTLAILPHATAGHSYFISNATLLAGVTDPDVGQTLFPGNLIAPNCWVTNTGDGWLFVPAETFTGPVSFTYAVTDANGGALVLSQSFTVDTPTAPAPHLVLSGTHTVAENSAEGTVIGTVSNAGAAVAGLTYSLLDNNGGTYVINHLTGVVTIGAGAAEIIGGPNGGALDGNRLDYESFPHQQIVVVATAADGTKYYNVIGIDLTNVFENHQLEFGPGNDTFTAPNDENWRLLGQGGTDTLTGAGGNDTFYGGTGNDTMVGGGGNDTFEIGRRAGFDSIDGGTGTDTIKAVEDNVAIGLTTFTGIEAITADGHAGVTISGTMNADTLDFTGVTLTGIAAILGSKGADTITGSAGDDTIVGGYGDDVLAGGQGNDTFLIGASAGKDSIDGGAGTDTIKATADNLKLSFSALNSIEAITADGHSGIKIVGTSGADTLDFSATTLTGIVSIEGGAGADTITGSAGNDTIVGGTGIDALNGGQGNDTFLVALGAGADSYNGGAGTDTIKAAVDNVNLSFTSLTSIEAISADGHSGVTIVGSTLADTIDLTGITLTGIAAITGGMGDDTIKGSAGNDTIIGGAGADTLTGNGGSDTFAFTAVSSSLTGVKADHVTDFATGDKIDLSAIDADAVTAGVQHFSFIGTADFTGLGQLRLGTDGGHAALYGNTVGSLKADFEIVLDNNATIHLADLVL
ncbi:cadherin-like domain-containing protein [Novosphingobium sp. FKTRR1]|uniref:beta strand repeat-containing protein n=1 Tax=Novosphingobium sp. FKTRR1 TaxID=2879118 RepID=UPI001CF0827F|nr:cadherin-like domain-containing protein [Novosphingobium sp. FKTRR1]